MSVITGTANDDALNGTDGADTIEGLGGNDVVEAGGGDDIVRGGDGYDVLWGGLGGDSIEAGGGGGEIYGEAGNDALIGGAGADYIWDGAGDDIVSGGGGDDVLRSSWYTRGGISISPSGSDTLDGGDGNDLILIHRENTVSGNVMRAIGGAGRDTIEIGSYGGNNTFIVDAGLDDDVINIRAERFETFMVSAGGGNDLVFFELLSSPASLTLGAGADIVRIGQFVSIRVGQASITIEDFGTGAGGDRLDFDTFVAAALTNWDQATNPFGTGHLRLLEKGGDTILQIDRDGAGGAYGFVNLVTFSNVAGAALTAWNLDGYDPAGGAGGQTITGTEGADSLNGTAGADTIDGLGGNDRIEGGGGDDLIRGGGGYDVIWGGIGADRIEAGADGGEIFGEQGGDTLIGGAGADVIWDGAGDDLVSGGGGNDELRSSWYRRDEVSMAATGSDTLDGGDGDDLILVRREGTTSGETIRTIGGVGNDIIDIISTGTNAYIVDAGTGDDWVQIRSEQRESYTVSAGDGRDLVFVELASGPVAVHLGAGEDVLRIGQQVNLRLGTAAITVEDFQTGAFGDRLDFDVFLANSLIGWDSAANPFSTGHLQLVESGADTLLRVDRDAGGSAHSFVTLVTFQNSSAASFTLENLDGFAPDGSVQGRTIAGTEGDDTLNGTAGGDTIDGLGGNDRIEGGGGDDLIRGGTGYDVIWGGLGADTIEAGADGGEMYGEAGADVLTGGAGGDRIVDGAGDDVVTGGAGDDQLRSSTYFRNDASASSSGSDRLDGGDGDDLIWIMRDGTTAGDVVTAIGGAGRDTIDIGSYGGRNAYSVDSGADDDLVILVSSESEAFTVQTGTGNDLVQIDHIAGSATVTLGAGADVLRIGQFQQNHLLTASIVVTDFQGGIAGDRLDFDVFVASALIGWDGTTDPFAAGYLRLVWTGADTLLQIDRDASASGHGVVTLVTFRNAESSLFTPYHLDGYTPITRATGSEEADGLEGSGTKDWIEGLGGNDVINTGSGDDLLDGGAGGDWMEGGPGDDVYFVDNEADSIVEHSGEGIDEVRTVFAVASLLGSHVENLTSNANVSHDFRGSALNNVVRGGALRDMIRLQDGGNDTAIAGDGNDTIYFGAAFNALDTVDAGTGVDAIILQGNYSAGVTLGSGTTSNIAGVESISLAPGHFADWGDTAGNFYDYKLTAIDANVPSGGILRINGHHLRSGEDFTFDGALEADGRFFVFGGLGVDQFTGGSGNDIFVFGHDGRFGATDVAHGGLGYDSLYLRGDYDLNFTLGGFGTFTGIESLTLGWASDTQFVVGGDGEFDYNIVWDDSMLADDARITVNGSGLASNETMIFDASDEAGGDFRLWGGASNDTITGGGGNDLIYGGLGADLLRGNGGADVFRYHDRWESYAWDPNAFDIIQGFTHGVDLIDLAIIDANVNAAGDQAFRFIGSAAFSTLGNSVGELRAFRTDAATNTWRIEADVSGDGSVDFMVQIVVEAGQPLTAADFIL